MRCSPLTGVAASIIHGPNGVAPPVGSIKMENPGYYCSSYTPPGPDHTPLMTTVAYSGEYTTYAAARWRAVRMTTASTEVKECSPKRKPPIVSLTAASPPVCRSPPLAAKKFAESRRAQDEATTEAVFGGRPGAERGAGWAGRGAGPRRRRWRRGPAGQAAGGGVLLAKPRVTLLAGVLALGRGPRWTW